ncbi:mitogen-activated protein kinase kinase kinase [Trifolium repens]|nr:mitogen-activated protein kinase kinase kinase [Trifolium repens]
MDSKKLRRKPTLERRNALNDFDYDAGSSSSSFGDSSGSLYTRYMDAPQFRSSSDILPSLKKEEVDKLSEKCEDRDRDRDRDSVRVTDEVAETVVVGSGGGIKGVINREMAEKESEEVHRVSPKREDEDVVVDNAAMIDEIVDGLSDFSISNEDDSSSSAMEPRSNNVSPNGRIKRVIRITSGCWRKGKFLGAGSFGSVYEGIYKDGFFFAVKEVSLLDQGDQGKQSVYQLEQEIALLSRFKHDNIVKYYGTEMDESKLYIFIEFMTKGSLRNLYQTYTLQDSQVSAYTRQILHGLKYLHDQNVVHRDIKCANILVHTNGSVKLADFGLAKATKLNDVKSCKGTALWMAPEVVKGKNNKGYGLPADVWSLGCTVLEMLTRKFPYSDFEWVEAIFKIGKEEPPPIPDTLSRDAKDFILQCLQVNPEASELHQSLAFGLQKCYLQHAKIKLLMNGDTLSELVLTGFSATIHSASE